MVEIIHERTPLAVYLKLGQELSRGCSPPPRPQECGNPGAAAGHVILWSIRKYVETRYILILILSSKTILQMQNLAK